MISRIMAQCYASTSHDAAGVLACLPPVDLEIARINCIKCLKKQNTCVFRNYFDSIRHLKEYLGLLVGDIWQERWETLTKRRITFKFFPVVSTESKTENTWISLQFFTGHQNFVSHLYRVGKADDDLCPVCGVKDDPLHRFSACKLFDNEKRDVLNFLGANGLELCDASLLLSRLLEFFVRETW